MHTEWSDGWGGQEIRIISEMEGVREYGAYVALACRRESRIAEEALKRGFDVYFFPFKGSFDRKTIQGLAHLIKEKGFTIVNTHSGKDTWCGGLAAKLAGAKFIRTRHLSNPINSSRLNFINELADFVITTGESVREAMIQNNRIKPEKILSIPTGVDTDIFNPGKYEKNECRDFFGLPKDAKIVGNLGVLRAFKRHDVFLDIAKEFQDILFVIGGDGPQKPNLLRKIETEKIENVRLLGHVQESAKFLACLDVFVLTSDSNEGVPQSLMQALAMNLPCIAADIGSIRDLYNDANFVLLSEWKKELFVETLKSIENSIERRDFIIENYSKKKMISECIKVYKKL